MKSRRGNFTIITLSTVIILAISLTGCSNDTNALKDGYYTAEDSVGIKGWYEFVTIYVKNGAVVSVEYNAKNSSGFIKAWDMSYMRQMNEAQGTYPNEYTRSYVADFLKTQSIDDIDAISGATHSYHTFIELVDAALKKAKTGDRTVALVDVEHQE